MSTNANQSQANHNNPQPPPRLHPQRPSHPVISSFVHPIPPRSNNHNNQTETKNSATPTTGNTQTLRQRSTPSLPVTPSPASSTGTISGNGVTSSSISSHLHLSGSTSPISEDESTKTAQETIRKTLQDEIELLALLCKFGTYFATFFFGYIIGLMGLSLVWISIASFLLVIRDRNRMINENRVEFHRSVAGDEAKFIKSAIDSLPSWVHFPDTERAEWINKTLKQMWPFLSEYISNLLKGQIEQNINEMMPDYLKGLRFDQIDFGSMVSNR